jgi:hypothetical protein
LIPDLLETNFMDSLECNGATEAVVRLYPELGLATDALPYTPEFTWLRGKVEEAAKVQITDREFWLLLTRLRKRKKLPRLRK